MKRLIRLSTGMFALCMMLSLSISCSIEDKPESSTKSVTSDLQQLNSNPFSAFSKNDCERVIRNGNAGQCDSEECKDIIMGLPCRGRKYCRAFRYGDFRECKGSDTNCIALAQKDSSLCQ